MKIKETFQKTIQLILCLTAVLSLFVSEAYALTALPKISAENVNGKCGQTVDIKISLESNPGIISMMFDLEFDNNALELVKVQDCAVLGTWQGSPQYNGSPYRFYWTKFDENTDNNGNISVVTFKIKDNAKPGKYAVCIKPSAKNIFDYDFKKISFESVNGSVTVSNSLCADINLDGDITSLDSVILIRHLAHWTGYESFGAEGNLNADLDSNGEITILDSVILIRHLAHWPGYMDLPYNG